VLEVTVPTPKSGSAESYLASFLVSNITQVDSVCGVPNPGSCVGSIHVNQVLISSWQSDSINYSEWNVTGNNVTEGGFVVKYTPLFLVQVTRMPVYAVNLSIDPPSAISQIWGASQVAGDNYTIDDYNLEQGNRVPNGTLLYYFVFSC
jgi:hypothetical protein